MVDVHVMALNGVCSHTEVILHIWVKFHRLSVVALQLPIPRIVLRITTMRNCGRIGEIFNLSCIWVRHGPVLRHIHDLVPLELIFVQQMRLIKVIHRRLLPPFDIVVVWGLIHFNLKLFKIDDPNKTSKKIY